MQNNYVTKRLVLSNLCLDDQEFIAELVNTAEWIKFIGDRNVRTQDEAKIYVEKLMNNPNVNYWVVKLQGQNTRIGVITFIKRDYLEHYDIGFAFLPGYFKNGYAYEAAMPVLHDGLNNPHQQQILAATVKENIDSIKLLQKLGFRFEKEIEVGDELLSLYACRRSVDN